MPTNETITWRPIDECAKSGVMFLFWSGSAAVEGVYRDGEFVSVADESGTVLFLDPTHYAQSLEGPLG